LKCKTPNFLASNVVYKLTCERNTSDVCIGMTSRHLMTRIEEHLNEEGPQRSAVNDHLKSCRTCQNEKDKMKLFAVVRKCRSDYETKINEALMIKKLSPFLNKPALCKRQFIFTSSVLV